MNIYKDKLDRLPAFEYIAENGDTSIFTGYAWRWGRLFALRAAQALLWVHSTKTRRSQHLPKPTPSLDTLVDFAWSQMTALSNLVIVLLVLEVRRTQWGCNLGS
jgi:hypothetical protein